MTLRHPRWGIIFLAISIIGFAAAGYFALQLRRTITPPSANFLAADKNYGVTIDLTRYDDDTLAATLTALHDQGFIWLRQPILWAELEPAAGQFDWQALDRVFTAVLRENEEAERRPQKLKLLVVLHTAPAWARAANTPPTSPPVEVSDFGAFARVFAARYGNNIDHYQIWHEPNLSANWGNGFVDPGAYAGLLREAALNIRAADPQAVILSAALAPTLENGPLNLNELTYLDQLYQANANRWFDVVAGQAYGFASEPADPAQADGLTFSRIQLLHQVMLNHHDTQTPVWATAFGWNALPADWTGPPSPWRSDAPETQAQRTAAAITYARHHWPWLGPMLAIRWDAVDLMPDDPARGFALQKTPPVLAAIQAVARSTSTATAGRYPANHPSGRYSPGWRFAQTQADIPRHEPRLLTITFEGTRLDLLVNRGPYRGYLWVTIDDQPANALPQDSQGRSYVVLYDPLRESEPVTLAQNLSPGPHKAMIEAEGGWGQWPVSGWAVFNENKTQLARWGFTVATTVAVLGSFIGLGWFLSAPAKAAKVAWAWGEILVALYAMVGERGQIIITFVLAMAFYIVPGWSALILLPLLALAVLLRPDLGLAVVAFSLSFFQAIKQLPFGSFAPVELALALTMAGFIFRTLLSLGRMWYTFEETPPPGSRTPYPIIHIPYPTSTDWAALTLVALALASTLNAANFGVSIHEWRVLVLESVIFYFLVRLGLDFNPQLAVEHSFTQNFRRPPAAETFTPPSSIPKGYHVSNLQSPAWAWRLVDAFVAGAILQALIALYLYFFTDQAIMAEGVRRALGLAYASPNNLSLFLDRVWPILLVVTLWHSFPCLLRRWAYGAGLLIVSVTLYLTFSKGALLLGLPAGVLAMVLFYILRSRTERHRWRFVLIAALGGLALLALALIPLSQTARFRTTLDLTQGSTGFFRLKLWQASLTMLRDHWLLGVGPDNFLYQYRTRYILPEAWQEPNLSHPHNLILDFGTRLGLGGIVLLVWLQLAFWRNAWQLYQKLPEPLILGMMGSMVIFLSHGLVDNSYFLVDLAFVFFLTVGIVQRLAEKSKDYLPSSA